MMQGKIHVFLSYAHKDKVLKDQLTRHLSLLKRRDDINVWHDCHIGPGTEWERDIETKLNTAHLILLLVSPNFIDSEYCYGKEMKRAVERHNLGDARVIPIILCPVDWQEAPFGKLLALPSDARPVTMWRNRNQAFLDITQARLYPYFGSAERGESKSAIM